MENKVLYWFKQITKIPRGSGNTDAIAEYCVDFAKERGLWYRRDEYNNIIIKKPASSGYENAPAIILQGHIDMVCEKDEGVEFDFKKDSIRIIEKDGFLTADGTTLGADDGIAVAMIFAVLDSDLPHPAIEAVLTSDEEIGLIGALGMDMSDISARRLINIDSETEGTFTVSCAGGVVVQAVLPLEKKIYKGSRYEISVSGLMGGHSGTEIHKGHANANVLMGRILYELGNVGVTSLRGGEKDNVITVSSKAEIISDNDVCGMVKKVSDEIAGEFREPDMKIECRCLGETECQAFDSSFSGFFMSVPNGVISMSQDIDGLVKTSLNCGIVNIENEGLMVSFSVRSSVESEKHLLVKRLRAITKAFGGEALESGDYPGWDFNPDSKLLELMTETFSDMFGEKPKIEAIHAGLECGAFAGKLRGLECVSIGPDIFDIHTTAERLDIASLNKTWDFLTEVLKRSI